MIDGWVEFKRTIPLDVNDIDEYTDVGLCVNNIVESIDVGCWTSQVDWQSKPYTQLSVGQAEKTVTRSTIASHPSVDNSSRPKSSNLFTDC
jgi:hypothetical protein